MSDIPCSEIQPKRIRLSLSPSLLAGQTAAQAFKSQTKTIRVTVNGQKSRLTRLTRGAAQQDGKQRPGIGVVAECPIKMDEQIAILGPEDEAGTELEGIPSKVVLFVTGGPRSSPCLGVVTAENVK